MRKEVIGSATLYLGNCMSFKDAMDGKGGRDAGEIAFEFMATTEHLCRIGDPKTEDLWQRFLWVMFSRANKFEPPDFLLKAGASPRPRVSA